MPIAHKESKMHWPMWEKEKAYQKQDVFRTETIPSWGFWEVTKAGTSGTTAPVGYGDGDTATNGSCELILRRLTKGGSTVDDWRLWKKFLPNTAYAKGDVFRTPTTPSWGYWEVTEAGTSGGEATVPSNTTELATATSGTMECILQRLGSGSGGGTEIITRARAWAMGANSPDGDTDADSPTGYTQSAKTWALNAKNDALRAEQAADNAEMWGTAAEEFAAQTETQVETTAWNAATTYNYPDVVHYTDGYSYRCVGQNVVGDVPGVSQNWVCLTRMTSSTWEYDTQGGLMPVINPIGDEEWEIDTDGCLMPRASA